jgi:hypothetical protein
MLHIVQQYLPEHSPPSFAEIKNDGAILSSPDKSSWRDA